MNDKIKRLLDKLDKAYDANIISEDDYVEITLSLLIADSLKHFSDKDGKDDDERAQD